MSKEDWTLLRQGKVILQIRKCVVLFQTNLISFLHPQRLISHNSSRQYTEGKKIVQSSHLFSKRIAVITKGLEKINLWTSNKIRWDVLPNYLIIPQKFNYTVNPLIHVVAQSTIARLVFFVRVHSFRMINRDNEMSYFSIPE